MALCSYLLYYCWFCSFVALCTSHFHLRYYAVTLSNRLCLSSHASFVVDQVENFIVDIGGTSEEEAMTLATTTSPETDAMPTLMSLRQHTLPTHLSPTHTSLMGRRRSVLSTRPPQDLHSTRCSPTVTKSTYGESSEVARIRLFFCRLSCVSSRGTRFLPSVKLRFWESKHIDRCPRSEAGEMSIRRFLPVILVDILCLCVSQCNPDRIWGVEVLRMKEHRRIS